MALRPLYQAGAGGRAAGEYRAYLSAVWMQTMSREQEDYEKAAEFIALHAFLLGVRTGRGLSDSLRA